MMKKLLGPRLLVEIEPDEEYFKGANSIIKPETVHESPIGFGKVVMVGMGTETKKSLAPIEGVKVGDRVAFIKFLVETQTNQALALSMGDEKLIVELKDVVVVIPG